MTIQFLMDLIHDLEREARLLDRHAVEALEILERERDTHKRSGVRSSIASTLARFGMFVDARAVRRVVDAR